jgi:hypothetical protein
MKNLIRAGAIALLAGIALSAQGRIGQPVVVTMSNAAANQLLVYSTNGTLIQTVSTQGQGGIPSGGNSGGIAVNDQQVAVINFGSSSVSLFKVTQNGFKFTQLIPSASSPVSVAFGNGHLYILGTTMVESHPMFGEEVSTNADGMAHLSLADGSAAQVGVVPNQLIITEKGTPGAIVAGSSGSGVIEAFNLSAGGTISGTPVQVVAPNLNTPLGLITQGNDAYVTIAHADNISLVRNDAVLTTTGSGSQSAPCWLALDGPFLFSANSPSHTISRYAVYGQKIVQDAAVAFTVTGNPTEIVYGAGLVATIDGVDLWILSVDEDGNLTRSGMTPISAVDSGVAIVLARY